MNRLLIDAAVRAALDEDLGLAGDITTLAVVPAATRATATFVARETGVVAGLDLARAAFRLVDADLRFAHIVADGDAVAPGEKIAVVSGSARSILTAERVALNFLGRLSGVASLTGRYVAAARGTRAQIVCTRKTTPGLRAFEKHAVVCGGGRNHRFGLFDAVLIKDNHIAVAGGVVPALRAARNGIGHLVKIEIEVDTLGQLAEVLAEGADIVLLDNMGPDTLAEAVALTSGRARLEASGGVNLDTVGAIARSGVDLISVGALTHSAPVLDIGLDIA